ncbi:MAG: HAD family hydrolase [Nitrospirota bacterium]
MEKIIDQKDNPREGLTTLKLLQLLRLFLPWNTKTLARLDKFKNLDIEKLNKLSDLNIKGIILDTDDCIAHNHGDILPENVEHIKELNKKGIKIAIYSNMAKSDRYEPIEKYAKILTNLPPKPSKKGFEQAVKALGVPKSQIVMIGDNYITDSGSIHIGVPFIKVNPIGGDRGLIMKAYDKLRNFYDKISRLHDKFRPPPISL